MCTISGGRLGALRGRGRVWYAPRMRVAFETLGCRLNQFETDALERAADEAGHVRVDGVEEADVYVLNTCTITNAADGDARQLLRRARRRNPQARLVVTGCYATREPEALASLPGVAAVVGNGEKHELLSHLGVPMGEGPDVNVGRLARRMPFAPMTPSLAPRRARAYLKIQDGCDYRCSFCIVPAVRGGSRSLEPEAILGQLQELVDAGVPEVVLTGVHLGTYGRDLSPRVDFHALLRMMLPKMGGARLRLGSLDPHEVDDKLIDLFEEFPDQLCRHLHLPVQSLDPQVLRDMRRAHTADDFVALTGRLAERVPGMAIGADVIVGFPGESDEAFERTERTLARLPITYLHVFSYSKRDDTVAATMPNQVDPRVKSDRNRALRQLADEKQRAFRRAQAASPVPALVFPQARSQTGEVHGLTDNYLSVDFDGAAPRGEWVRVQLDPDGPGCQRV